MTTDNGLQTTDLQIGYQLSVSLLSPFPLFALIFFCDHPFSTYAKCGNGLPFCFIGCHVWFYSVLRSPFRERNYFFRILLRMFAFVLNYDWWKTRIDELNIDEDSSHSSISVNKWMNGFKFSMKACNSI